MGNISASEGGFFFKIGIEFVSMLHQRASCSCSSRVLPSFPLISLSCKHIQASGPNHKFLLGSTSSTYSSNPRASSSMLPQSQHIKTSSPYKLYPNTRHDQGPEAVCSTLDVFPGCFLSESIDAILSLPPHLIFLTALADFFPLPTNIVFSIQDIIRN